MDMHDQSQIVIILPLDLFTLLTSHFRGAKSLGLEVGASQNIYLQIINEVNAVFFIACRVFVEEKCKN